MLDPEGVAGAVAISGGIGFVGAANGGMVAITGSLVCENGTSVIVVLKCCVICFSTGGASNVGQGGNLAISGGVSSAGTSGAIVMFTPDAVHEKEVGLIISQCCLFVTSCHNVP